ncbi:MAG TPA: methyltransferase domain-containing protein [Candidatus Bathyarchaeia archaeon]|nr:methyltransferase domain-containing protein [Candidatus Bathyarchaeia archaeon]
MNNLTSLNLGCGPDDWGDVRVDVDFATQIGTPSKLNVRADAHALPFRDKTFGTCRCWHVLEHVKNPIDVLNEIRRVSLSADVRFPVDEGYKMLMMIGILNLEWITFKMAYLTFRRRVHKWIIKPFGRFSLSDRYIMYPSWTIKGRKSRVLRRLLRRYYFEWKVEV